MNNLTPHSISRLLGGYIIVKTHSVRGYRLRKKKLVLVFWEYTRLRLDQQNQNFTNDSSVGVNKKHNFK